jgi:hypothetical protein
MFTAFPGQSVGIGLLALRASLALWITSETLTATAPSLATLSVGVVLILLFACGFGVRIGAAIAIGAGLYLVAASEITWSAERVAQFLELGALGLLGPGAYSIDAILFGRRTITLRSGE